MYFDYVKKLTPIKDGIGECIEVDFHPRNVRKYATDDNIDILIRQIGPKWKIWRKS